MRRRPGTTPSQKAGRVDRARRGLRRITQQFWHESKGQALLETAIVMAILPFLFVGVSEFSEADMVRRRVDSAAGAAADLVARVDQVSTADLNAMKDNLINVMMQPFNETSLGVVITSVVTDENGQSTVAWSFARGGTSSARQAGTAVVLPAGLNEPSTSLVMAETTYPFTSTLSTLIVGTITMQGASYSAPRLGAPVERVQ
ncbi:MAG: TadE/TadG family type IV pilus assembly protein [Pseudomonadota bacterium]